MADKRIVTSRIKPGDIFSETSHYVHKDVREETKDRKKVRIHTLTHLGSGLDVELGDKYVEDLLVTADQFTEEVEVGKEDKYWTVKQIEEALKKKEIPADVKLQPREGDVRLPGIRTIWSNIFDAKVFTVRFKKADKKKTDKKVKEERDAQLKEIENLLGTTTRGNTTKLLAKVAEIQANPVLDYEPGELRTLRGYKVQFTSINGAYDVIDMDLDEKDPNRRIRSVNVNEIVWLVINGVKYTVK